MKPLYPLYIIRRMVRPLLIALLLLLPALAACDKVDDNGDFGGYWRLEAYGPDADPGALAAPKSITWGVRCNVIEVRRLFGTPPGGKEGKYYYTFVRNGDVLQLTAAYECRTQSDVAVPFSELPADWAIPHDGRLKVLQLSRSTLVLEGRDATVMRFRKL